MNQFFEGLANQNNAEVSSTNIKEDFNIRAGGTMTIVKGIVSLDISWWADVYKSNYPGYVSVEDCDYDEANTFINGIKIADDKEAILFVCDSGEIKVRCDADCCSHTWIEHIELPALGFPCLVVSVDDLDLPGSDNNHPDHDYLQVYGCKITTDKGDIVIDAFGGSGTTMVACEQTGRKARIVEYDPKYCQVIVDRMLKLDPTLKVKRNGLPYEPKTVE